MGSPLSVHLVLFSFVGIKHASYMAERVVLLPVRRATDVMYNEIQLMEPHRHLNHEELDGSLRAMPLPPVRNKIGHWGCSSVVEDLPNMPEPLDSIPIQRCRNRVLTNMCLHVPSASQGFLWHQWLLPYHNHRCRSSIIIWCRWLRRWI